MRLYVDTNILLAGLTAEPDETELSTQTSISHGQGNSFISSVLTAVEIDRVLRRGGDSYTQVTPTLLHGIDLMSITPRVVDLARSFPVRYLKTLDALHLATALLSNCDAVMTLDQQFARACEDVGLAVA